MPTASTDAGLRRRTPLPDSGSTPSPPEEHPPSTSQQAVAFKPDVRVRMTVLRDYISIFRSRYMDSFFGLACVALVCQLTLVMWRGLGAVEPGLLHYPHSSVRTAEGFTHAAEDYARVAGRAVREASKTAGGLSVLDACGLVYRELGWAWPLAMAAAVAYLLRRRSTVYLLDFALWEPPEEWKVSQVRLWLHTARRWPARRMAAVEYTQTLTLVSRLNQAELISLVKDIGQARASFEDSDVTFMQKVLSNSGTGDKTAWPPGITRCRDPDARQDESMVTARQVRFLKYMSIYIHMYICIYIYI